MNYKETLNWMFNKLPMYQTQGASAYKANLDNIISFANHLNNPQDKLKTIHVAGTNGKGSTSSLLASILQESGYKVGLYTSPHLKDYRERIRINGKKINKKYVVNFIEVNKTFLDQNSLSFFEMSVGLAFEYFNHKKVDLAVIEVGMGGRLDSTNIIQPLISIITNIGLDHTQFLGNTLEKIAAEKAGIIKTNIPVIIGETTLETKPVFTTIAKEKKASIYFAEELSIKIPECGLKGDYQKLNCKTVLQSIKVLKSITSLNILNNHVEDGLKNVVKNTNFLGRWQELNNKPKTICDTAHNKHGLEIVLNQIKNEKYNQLHIVLGFVNDKNLDEILPLFPKEAKYYFSEPKNLRALKKTVLLEKATFFGLNGQVYNSISKAYKQATKNALPEDFIFIGGSTFVVAEIL